MNRSSAKKTPAIRKPARKPAAAKTPQISAVPDELNVAEPKRTLTDIAYERLEEAIVTLRIPPGTAVSELTLSNMLNIGRTPIREAIQRLAREHLLQVLPQRGLLVPQTDLRKQLRLLETPREVERPICRSAARRATPEERGAFFHLRDAFRRRAGGRDGITCMGADNQFSDRALIAARDDVSEGAMRLMHGLSRRFWYCHDKHVAAL